MAFAVFDRRRESRRHKAWIDIAKTAIAGDHKITQVAP